MTTKKGVHDYKIKKVLLHGFFERFTTKKYFVHLAQKRLILGKF
jgi:hypothetical protein